MVNELLNLSFGENRQPRVLQNILLNSQIKNGREKKIQFLIDEFLNDNFLTIEDLREYMREKGEGRRDSVDVQKSLKSERKKFLQSLDVLQNQLKEIQQLYDNSLISKIAEIKKLKEENFQKENLQFQFEENFQYFTKLNSILMEENKFLKRENEKLQEQHHPETLYLKQNLHSITRDYQEKINKYKKDLDSYEQQIKQLSTQIDQTKSFYQN